jgi:hypothetical protein
MYINIDTKINKIYKMYKKVYIILMFFLAGGIPCHEDLMSNDEIVGVSV